MQVMNRFTKVAIAIRLEKSLIKKVMKKILYSSAAILLSLSSCLNVFQPLITPEKYLNEPKIEGTWKSGKQLINIIQYAKSPLAKEQLIGGKNDGERITRNVVDSI